MPLSYLKVCYALTDEDKKNVRTMRKVTYFRPKLRRVVNRSAGQAEPGQAGSRSDGQTKQAGQTGVAYIKQLLAHCIWPRPACSDPVRPGSTGSRAGRHQKAAKWSRRRSVKCGQAKSATHSKRTTTTTTTTALTMQLTWQRGQNEKLI